MSPEPFVSRVKALQAKKSEKGYGDENVRHRKTKKKMLNSPFRSAYFQVGIRGWGSFREGIRVNISKTFLIFWVGRCY